MDRSKFHKRAIIRMAEACPSMTQSELVAWARKKFKLRAKPSRNAISDIMKNAESIMSATYGDDSQHKPTPPPLEMRLAAWNIDMERRNICLSRELVIGIGLQFGRIGLRWRRTSPDLSRR
ncbi:hypothetical protein PR003_g26478 [Phytophthora rubi]|uniref:ARS-binding protein 1 N-terminal domain-containing protein n=1 Tax=Phytophthora rubi TaxID=129364 RepID=A0A6A4CBH0_9STRA|nr:hypothetical protein PR003_g26478 [Phytophthora rubi]